MSEPLSVADRRAAAARYDVRRIHPLLRYATASDRYAAWIGQVYPRERWAGEVQTRRKRVGRETFEERLLPIASAEDYFEHFGSLELDFPYYRPLLDAQGKPSPGLFTLEHYAEHAPPSARFLLKAPQAFAARRLRRTGPDGRATWVDNPTYLDARAFTRQFAEPAARKLGVKLGGIIFEQEYARVRESPSPEAFVAELDRFFADVPEGLPYHLEIRSAHLLTPAYFELLERRGLGFVFSHWTWLPSIREQWRLAGERFSSSTGQAILRLLNPREMSYDEAFAHAYPFERAAPALAETPQARQMIDEATALAYKAVEAGVTLHTVCNNRAWGNSPDLARTLADRFLDFAERRGV